MEKAGPNGDWTSKNGIKSGFDSQRLGIESTTLGYNQHLPSGKLTYLTGISPSLIGKTTINVPISIAVLNYQRVNLEFNPPCWCTFDQR